MSNNLDNISLDSEYGNNSSSSDSESVNTSSILQPSISVAEISNNSNVTSPPLLECPSNSYLIWNHMPNFSIEQCSYDPDQGVCEHQNYSDTNQITNNVEDSGWNISNMPQLESSTNQITNNVEDSGWNISNMSQLESSTNPYNLINVVGGTTPWEVSENIHNSNNSTSLNTITNAYVNTTNQNNSDSSNDEEQTTDYNNEESITADEPNPPTLQNVGLPNLNLENISNIDMSGNPVISEVNANSSGVSSQYSMLYNDDVNNPFYKCNLGELDYDTDEEESKETYRVMYFWNYEFNYDYFSLNDVYIFNNKTDLFKSKINELKSIRNANSNNSTGNIIKLESSNNISNLVNLYLIAYYDNAKTNIEFYGIYNQEIDEEKLIENIKLESIYGKKGSISSNLITNLGENDFIVLHRKVNIN